MRARHGSSGMNMPNLLEEILVDVVALSGGELVGRTRLQKTVYLLDAVGMQSGASYYYHNFGPFSDDVADAISDAKFLGALVERSSQRQSDGSPFSIFSTPTAAGSAGKVGSIDKEKAGQLLMRFKALNATVLELAATIHWLKFVESIEDWRSELKRRKGSKTEYGRLEQAAALLAALGFKLT
jgi:uncharacterized protein